MKKIIFIALLLIPFSVNAATITITIPDDKITAVVDAFATQYNYQNTITDESGTEIPNPVSKTQFAKNIIKTFIKEVHIAAQLKDLEITRQTIITNAETDTSAVTVE